MRKFITLLIILISLNINALAQKRAVNALSDHDFERAASESRDLTDDNLYDALGNYLLARVYEDSTNPKKNLFIAYRYIRIAAANADKMPADKLKNALKYVSDFQKLVITHNAIIDSLLTAEVIRKKDLTQVIRFQAECSDSKYIGAVYDLRTSLEFDLVKKTNTITAFNNFLARFPGAKETPQAISARDELAFEKIKGATAIRIYNEFIETYQTDSQLVNKAITLRNKAAYEIYKDYYRRNDVENLTHFLLYFPKADNADILDIISKKNKLEYREAKSINTIEAYQTYIFRHPGFPEVEKALITRDSLVFEDVKLRNEKDPYFYQFMSTIPFAKQTMDLFLKNYRCFNSPEAATKEKISLAFDLANCKGTVQALTEFIDKYPNAEQEVIQAKARIKLLNEGN